MQENKKIILIGNYPKDRQESMDRFTSMLSKGFNSEGYETIIWKPKVFFASFANTSLKGAGKWFGYIDKWILFPLILKCKVLISTNRSLKNTRFHICDHSNAPYLKYLPKSRTAITCHDVLAIRGAMGFADAYCPASKFGKLLQKWILRNLLQATSIATVSKLTLNQLSNLAKDKGIKEKEWMVIYNSFNADFSPVTRKESQDILSSIGMDLTSPYILHVGSALKRKNRKLLLDMVHSLGNKWSGNICFAGKALDKDLIVYADSLKIKDRIISVVKPSHLTLTALYSNCSAFVFPSFSEGFGWPVIEAQACGAPVLASNIEPMPEVSGGAALHANPEDGEAFAKAFLTLQDPGIRDKLIQKGFENTIRFKPQKMIDKYLELHKLKNF